MKNKKGFTLVELLAVIVILALIMGIAVVSVGSVISTSREKAFRETAASILNGVRQRLYISNVTDDGQYTFKDTILEKGGKSSPYSGEIKYHTGTCTAIATGGDPDLCKASGLSCNSSTAASFVQKDSTGYKICLVDTTNHWVFATDKELLDNTAIISTPTS